MPYALCEKIMADFTITLSNNPIPFDPAQGPSRLTFKFIIKDSQYSGVEEHTLLTFGEFEMGNDDDDETVYFPSNMKVEFQLNTDVVKFENLLIELRTKKTIAQIFRNGIKIFSGYLYADDVNGLQYTRRISVTIIDQFKQLETVGARPSVKNGGLLSIPFNYDLDATVKIIDLIKDLLTRPMLADDPYVTDIVNLCTLECQANIGGVMTDVPFTDFATRYSRWFSPDTPFDNCLQVLKAIFQEYGCIGIIGFDAKLYIIPRKYNLAPAYMLGKENMMKEPELKITPSSPGLNVEVYICTKENGKHSELRTSGRANAKVDGGETIQCMDAGGTMPGGYAPNLFADAAHPNGIDQSYYPHEIELKPLVIVGGVLYNAEYNSYRSKLPDGTFSSRAALYEVVFQDIWNCIKYNRRAYNVEAVGNYQEINFSQYYYFENAPNTFYRLRKASYSLVNKTAKLNLIDSTIALTPVTQDVNLGIIMQASGAALEINNTRYTGEANQIINGSQQITAICANMFVSSSPQVTAYDGTLLTIPDDMIRGFYSSVELYVIYVAISKIGNAPQYAYPNPADNEADWYLLSTIPDQHIYDSVYEYKIVLPRVDAGKMPYWFWIGMKPAAANLFEKIPNYLRSAVGHLIRN